MFGTKDFTPHTQYNMTQSKQTDLLITTQCANAHTLVHSQPQNMLWHHPRMISSKCDFISSYHRQKVFQLNSRLGLHGPLISSCFTDVESSSWEIGAISAWFFFVLVSRIKNQTFLDQMLNTCGTWWSNIASTRWLLPKLSIMHQYSVHLSTHHHLLWD